MKPEQWVIEDIKAMRAITNRSPAQEAYLALLVQYTRMLQGKGE
jgi:hypothetical protein